MSTPAWAHAYLNVAMTSWRCELFLHHHGTQQGLFSRNKVSTNQSTELEYGKGQGSQSRAHQFPHRNELHLELDDRRATPETCCCSKVLLFHNGRLQRGSWKLIGRRRPMVSVRSLTLTGGRLVAQWCWFNKHHLLIFFFIIIVCVPPDRTCDDDGT